MLPSAAGKPEADEKEGDVANTEGMCDMCGHLVKNRQRAHIVAEGKKSGPNLLHLCPSCHVMSDTHIKPRLYEALKEMGVKELPSSWEKSLYEQNKQRLMDGIAAHEAESGQ